MAGAGNRGGLCDTCFSKNFLVGNLYSYLVPHIRLALFTANRQRYHSDGLAIYNIKKPWQVLASAGGLCDTRFSENFSVGDPYALH